MPAGRPPKYKTPEEMQVAIDAYFDDCPDKTQCIVGGEVGVIEVPCPTITGLALYLGFCDRCSMYDYQNNPEFSHTIKEARSRMELEYEKDLRYGKNTSGSIFALKNFGWTDRQQVDMKAEVKQTGVMRVPVTDSTQSWSAIAAESQQALMDDANNI